MRVNHEYDRGGALAYLAAWDVHRAEVFGRCEATTGIVPFMALVDQVMSQEPYASAKRVFWIVDNGSSHRGKAAVDRLGDRNGVDRRWDVPLRGRTHSDLGRGLAQRVDAALAKEAARSGAEPAREEFTTAVLAEVSNDGAELRLVHEGRLVRLDPAAERLPLAWGSCRTPAWTLMRRTRLSCRRGRQCCWSLMG
jgi:hypothetical protein